MNLTEFVAALSCLRFDNAFNPYQEMCLEHDQPNAPEIRRSNLEKVLSAAMDHGVESIWVARDLGYRGGRRTGLALTDDSHLESHAKLLKSSPLQRATKGPAVKERTASVIWDVLDAIDRPIFLWNVFPLHPHKSGDELTNRCHTKAERNACAPLLLWLVSTLKPRSVVAIGRDAQSALLELGIQSVNARHPSYGGQSEFISGMENLYNIAGIHSNKRSNDQLNLEGVFSR